MELVATVAIVAVIALIAPIPLSMLMESLRKRPEAPSKLDWDRDLELQYLTVDGTKLRYIRTGEGPPLVLLHTLRTQLDIFHKVIKPLARSFSVYALDYPGHGWSDIPDVDYAPPVFTRAVAGFLEQLEIDGAILAGVSIGGVIPLRLAADGNSRIKSIVSINPYDFARGTGLQRGNLVSAMVGKAALLPVIGETVMRMRLPIIERTILSGGVTRRDAWSPALRSEIWRSGCRPGHYQGFLSLLRHAAEWDESHQDYGRIKIPVLLLYGIDDWSNDAERNRTHSEISTSTLEIIEDGGHFLVLDQPDIVVKRIQLFAAGPGAG